MKDRGHFSIWTKIEEWNSASSELPSLCVSPSIVWYIEIAKNCSTGIYMEGLESCDTLRERKFVSLL